MNVPFLQYFYTKSAPKRVGLSHPSIVPYGAFLTKDNKNILFSIQNEREWRAFSKEIIKVSKISESKYKTPSLRLINKESLLENNKNLKINNKFCSFVATNPSGRRLDFVPKLQARKYVDCGGTLLNNTGRKIKGRGDQKWKIKYKY